MEDNAQRTSSARRRFRVIETIGKGGFGTVYRAEMSDAGGFSKQVALKAPSELCDYLAYNDARRVAFFSRVVGASRHQGARRRRRRPPSRGSVET